VSSEDDGTAIVVVVAASLFMIAALTSVSEHFALSKSVTARDDPRSAAFDVCGYFRKGDQKVLVRDERKEGKSEETDGLCSPTTLFPRLV
jgi:hypothetical protein